MKKPEKKSATLQERRELLQAQTRLAALPMDDVLNMANDVTAELSQIALDAAGRQAFQEAADLYLELATAWQNARAVLPEDMKANLQMLADYWMSQREEVQKQQEAAFQKETAERPEVKGWAETKKQVLEKEMTLRSDLSVSRSDLHSLRPTPFERSFSKKVGKSARRSQPKFRIERDKDSK